MPLGLLVDAHRQWLPVAPVRARRRRRVDGQLGAVEGDGGDRFVGGGLDVTSPVKVAGEVGREPQLVARGSTV
jgi:hypothetical protein